MKLVKPSFEIIEQEAGKEGLLRHIEKCGRTCYKSEDKITEDSAEKFVNMIINRGHTAMLEHGTVYLHKHVDYTDYDDLDEIANDWFYKYHGNNYSTASYHNDCKKHDINIYVTTNYRVLLQNNWLSDLQYQCEPTEYHEKRVTVKFVCDRGVSHEFVRHRVFSFAQESTRYCNYSKDKFGSECTFIEPCWFKDATYYASRKVYESELAVSEQAYFSLLDMGWIAQQARAVLPNSLKTELVMTGTIEQWEGFFKLRDDKQHAHPQAYELAHPLHEEFIKRGYLE